MKSALIYGDFCLPFVPRGMKFDGNVTYTFKKEYKNKINAVEDVKCICQFLKKNMYASKMYVKEDWDNMLDRFIKRVGDKSKEFEEPYVYEFMTGNYDGREVIW